jgi:hypothetical protein
MKPEPEGETTLDLVDEARQLRAKAKRLREESWELRAEIARLRCAKRPVSAQAQVST